MARLSKMAGALTAPEFEAALRRHPRLSDKAKEVARAVLVDGRTFEEVTEKYSTSKQLAHVWASKIYNAFAPTGWVSEMVVLPPELMAHVREMEREAREEWQASLGAPRIVRRA
ncbi:TrfB-related DNA-binding protein [Methyloterricola oryzae]|uniref:TrfB-related DNA-binding protein n=1 Tax=Methyloterricola oryzae TaxID=1495050 RepID=UPI0005EBE8CA|nr:TrfB-related DNA-binding protein [Methyloterricola oryzae]